MRFFQVLEALGGLGLFMLGMKTLAEGLQRVASGRFRRSVEKLVSNRFSATLTGGCLSSLLQSSGAASVLILGFVNAGLVSLYQALAMLIGTGLGATIAVQLITFPVSFLSLPVIFIGVILRFFSKRRRLVFLGEILLGAGLIFFGLEVMKSRFTLLGETAVFRMFHDILIDWRIISVLTGALLSFLLQSASTTIGVIIALTGSGVIGLDQGAAMAVGEVLGTAALAAVCSIGGTLTAKRTVFIYGLMSILSVAIVLLFFPLFLKLVIMLTPGMKASSGGVPWQAATAGTYSASHYVFSRAIANAYTLFSVFLAASSLPWIGFFARAAAGMLPGRKSLVDIEPNSRYLDFRIISTPPLAMLQATNELVRMAEVACSMVSDTVQQFYEFNVKRASLIAQKENLLDVLQKELSGFLVELARQPLTSEISAEIPVCLSIVNDLEGLGDTCETIMDCLQRKKEADVYFSDTAMDEIKSLAKESSYPATIALDMLEGRPFPEDPVLQQLRSSIHALHEKLKNNHLIRLSNGTCSILAGLLYIDIIGALVRIGEISFSILEKKKRML
jgi:phosphate:Na+ symporter